MRWTHRAVAVALTSMVWLPTLAIASARAEPACDQVATYSATADGDLALNSGAGVIGLTETSGLVAFSLTDPGWVIMTAAVRFAPTGVDGAWIGGQQVIASPGPEGVLSSGESFEFCLRAAPVNLEKVTAELPTTDHAPRQSRVRIIAL